MKQQSLSSIVIIILQLSQSIIFILDKIAVILYLFYKSWHYPFDKFCSNLKRKQYYGYFKLTKFICFELKDQNYLIVFSKVIFLQKIKQSMGQDRDSRTYYMTIMFVMILSGAMNTISDKFQDQQYVQEGSIKKYFYHPYVQTVVMYIAVSLALPSYLILKIIFRQQFQKRSKQAEAQGKKTNFNQFQILVCTCCDIVSSNLQGMALNFLPGSSYQITRGGSVATAFLFSKLLLKTQTHRHHVTGVVLTVFGILIVGLTNYIFSQHTGKSSDNGLFIRGQVLLLISLFLDGFSYVYGQKLFRRYHIEPIQFASYQGVYGLIISSILVMIYSTISCTSRDTCVFTDEGSFMESPKAYLQELCANHLLLFTILLQILTIFCYNISAYSITKYVSSVSTAICDVCRTFIVWVVGLIVTQTIGQEQENFKWQLTNSIAFCLQLGGFLILIFGNLLFNKIIYIPYLASKSQHQLQAIRIDQSDEASLSKQRQNS